MLVNLVELINSRYKSRRKFAEALGIDPGHLSNIINEKTKMPSAWLLKMSKHFNVSPREIDPNVEIFAPIDEKLMSSILTKVMQDMAAQDLLPEMNIVAQQAAELYNRAITSNESDMS